MARVQVVGPATFTAADGTNVSTYDSTNWQEQDGFNGFLRIYGNGYRQDFASATSDCYWKTSTFSNDQYAQVVIRGSNFQNSTEAIGVTLRATGTAYNTRNQYRIYYESLIGSGVVTVAKVVNGTETAIGANFSVTWNSGDTLTAEVTTVSGQAVINVYQNASLLGTRTDTTSIFTTGRPGICGYQGGGNTIVGDDFVAGDITAGTPGPNITANPSNASVVAPATANFSVTATASGGGTLSYQWERSNNSGGSWANVSTGTGGTTASYTTAATNSAAAGSGGDNGAQFRCQVTETGGTNPGTGTTTVATLTVTASGRKAAMMMGMG